MPNPRSVKPRGDLIDGRFVRAAARRGERVETLPARDADGGEVFAEIPLRRESVAEAVAAAERAAPRWSSRPGAERAAALGRLAAQIRNRQQDLASGIGRELGAPRWQCHSEVAALLDVIDWATARLADGDNEDGTRADARTTLPPGARVERRPRGVVAAIGAAPQPLLPLHLDLVAALAAGNTVVAKPARRAPVLAGLYAELLEEADFGRGVVNLVVGDDNSGRQLAESPGVDAVLLSGSRRAARAAHATLFEIGAERRLHARASARPAALVLADANVEQAALLVVKGLVAGSGLRCDSTRRVVVERAVLADLRARLEELLGGLKVGPPDAADSAMGPLPDEHAAQAYLEEAARVAALDGARAALAATRLERRGGAYVTPALVEVAPAAFDAAVCPDPVGPLLVLAPCDGPEHGVELINRAQDTGRLAVFSRDPRRREAVAAAQRAPLCVFDGATSAWRGARVAAQLAGVAPARAAFGALPGEPPAAAHESACVVIEEPALLDLSMLPPGLGRIAGEAP